MSSSLHVASVSSRLVSGRPGPKLECPHQHKGWEFCRDVYTLEEVSRNRAKPFPGKVKGIPRKQMDDTDDASHQ
ncbi:hypothetical protein Taro_032275 [Colocasia esculenta]|uniref:Uncharacterized protein n=1 Tax=Colocasia esculenta TaxID=4460 RepID=A0A843W5P3_COLES|nr:hypothetical protein [Colocasia esculenta]